MSEPVTERSPPSTNLPVMVNPSLYFPFIDGHIFISSITSRVMQLMESADVIYLPSLGFPLYTCYMAYA